MTWREQLICRILLIIATMVATDEQATQLKSLSTHIIANASTAAAA